MIDFCGGFSILSSLLFGRVLIKFIHCFKVKSWFILYLIIELGRATKELMITLNLDVEKKVVFTTALRFSSKFRRLLLVRTEDSKNSGKLLCTVDISYIGCLICLTKPM